MDINLITYPYTTRVMNIITPLGEIGYNYVRNWADQNNIDVSFFDIKIGPHHYEYHIGFTNEDDYVLFKLRWL